MNCTDEKPYTIKTINGIKTIINKGIPANKELQISANKIFSLGIKDNEVDSTTLKMPISVAVDSKGEIYVLDLVSCNIKKYSKDGEYLKTIGEKGTGPGEMLTPLTLTISNDTLLVYSNKQSKTLSKYDTDGNFIKSFQVKNDFSFLHPIGNGHFSALSFNYNQVDQCTETFIGLYDNNLKMTGKVANSVTPFKDIKNGLDILFPYTASNEKIFVSVHNENSYQIDVYNTFGEKLYQIRKNFRKITFNKKEKEANLKIAKINDKTATIEVKYKKPVINLYLDSQQRLWVEAAQNRTESNENDVVYDIFKDGIYQNSIKLNIKKANDFFDITALAEIIGNRIFVANAEKNCVDVFEY